MADRTSKRTGNTPWKHVYGVDRAYTRRVDAARARGQYTEPGTPSKAVSERRGKDGLPKVTKTNPYGIPTSYEPNPRLPR
jgi:hypothetical protein